LLVYTYIWAHRGASGHVTDNTFDSFKLAIEMGADGIESDVKLTKDGELVFYHDGTIKYNGKDRKIGKMTLSEIQSVDLGEGRTVPTVKEIIEYFKDKKNKYGNPINFSLDLGSPKSAYELIKLAIKYQYEEQIELTPSDDLPFIIWFMRKFRKISKKVIIVDSAKPKKWKNYLKWNYFHLYDKFKMLGVKAINLKAAEVNDKIIDEIHDNGFKSYVWDCHDEITIKKFISNNKTDAIYSNYPDLAVKIRKEIQNYD
jgi:glycerophosphoryl diester phosphodiesterase